MREHAAQTEAEREAEVRGEAENWRMVPDIGTPCSSGRSLGSEISRE